MTDSDLIERLRSEAEIADRPGQFDRLNAIARSPSEGGDMSLTEGQIEAVN